MSEKYTYENSGVNLKNAKKLTDILSAKMAGANLETFAAMFDTPALGADFSLAATTDGIGTKIIPLLERGLYSTIAQDLAAMNLNDLVCTGAKPLFFLDYIAANALDTEQISTFVLELSKILKKYNCALLGGETSEMGDFIQKNTFDAAGFLVGLINKKTAPNPDKMREGDIVIGLKSSGVHSNGFSLIRKLHKDGKISEAELLKMLAPTEIYANEILQLLETTRVSALANITGGGIISNLERAIPKGFKAVLDRTALPETEVFEILKKYVSKDEMFKTFNMGAGFCVIAPENQAAAILSALQKYEPFVFGKIEKSNDETRCEFKN